MTLSGQSNSRPRHGGYPGPSLRFCHFCALEIGPNESGIEATTRNGWAHVTCWFEGGPFERESRERAAAIR